MHDPAIYILVSMLLAVLVILLAYHQLDGQDEETVFRDWLTYGVLDNSQLNTSAKINALNEIKTMLMLYGFQLKHTPVDKTKRHCLNKIEQLYYDRFKKSVITIDGDRGGYFVACSETKAFINDDIKQWHLRNQHLLSIDYTTSLNKRIQCLYTPIVNELLQELLIQKTY